MPKLSIPIPNPLGQEAALERLKVILEKMKERYKDQVSDLTDSWTDNVLNASFKTYGFTVNAKVTVEPSVVRVDADLPFAAMMFKAKIEQETKSMLGRWLGDKPAGESPA